MASPSAFGENGGEEAEEGRAGEGEEQRVQQDEGKSSTNCKTS